MDGQNLMLMMPLGLGGILARTTGATPTIPSPTEAGPILVPRAPDNVPPFTPGDRGPDRRRTITALIAVAVLAVIGSVVGLVRSEQRDDRIAELTAERDDAVAAVATATSTSGATRAQLAIITAERDDLATRIGTLSAALRDRVAELATARSDLTIAIAERDDLVSGSDVLEASLRQQMARVAALETDVDELSAEISTLSQRLTTVQAQRDALARLFPVTFATSLVGADVVGRYDVELAQVYCTGLTNCGTLPDYDGLEIVRTGDGYLRVVVPGMASAGLYRTDGALFAVTDTTTALPACDGTPRVARTSMTIYPSGMRIDADGTRHVTSLAASILVEAPAVGGCPAALAFYGAELARTS